MKPRLLFVTAEAVPLAKTGGLGDMIGALAHALQNEEVDLSILMPGYPSALEQIQDLRHLCDLKTLPCAGAEGASLWRGHMPGDGNKPGAKVLLLRDAQLYERPGSPYQDEAGVDHPDNALRFAVLAHAAAEIAAGRTPLSSPHIVHAHDWHAGLTPLFIKQKITRASMRPATIFTIHNLAFQGNFPIEQAATLGLPEEVLKGDRSIEFWGKLSFLKAGLQYADCITTVSRSYAREILTPKFGHGMDGLLRKRAAHLVAVPNGIDTECWNPAEDPLIVRRYSAMALSSKTICKQQLQQSFGLPVDPFVPVMALGSRITWQKMADVVVQALPDILASHPRLQIAVLGRGEAPMQDAFKALADQYPERVGVHIGYEEKLAHQLHAGADILLHPSRFEPFGLTPLYAMRYGTVPIVSRVGGMIDTVIDANEAIPLEAKISEKTLASSRQERALVNGVGNGRAIDVSDVCYGKRGATGVLFDGEKPADISAAVGRAMALHQQPKLWRALQRNGMNSDFGWEHSSKRYVNLYCNLIADQLGLQFGSRSLPQSDEAVDAQPALLRA